MAFTKDQLLLPAAKVAQLTAALATATVPDPLQTICDEASLDVARMTSGYVIDQASMNNFIRSLALYRIYTNAGTGLPPNVENDRKEAMDELQAIAKGERPSYPRVATPEARAATGKGGSQTFVPGRMQSS